MIIPDLELEVEVNENNIWNLLNLGQEGYVENLYLNNIDYEINETDYHTQYHYDMIKPDMPYDKFAEEAEYNFSYNIQPLLDYQITCAVVFYNNYDCANSFDEMDVPETYLYAVYNLVKDSISKEDFEEDDGCYGGCLFKFLFKASVEDYFKNKKAFKNSITIPKGTLYGFHSNFQGSSSMFEQKLKKAITLPHITGNTNYDRIELETDMLTQGYSVEEIFGELDFIPEQLIIVS